MHVVYADIGRTCRTRLRSVPRSRLASPPRGPFVRSVGLSCSLAPLVPLPLPFAQRTQTRTVCVITGEGVRTGLVITGVHWGSTCVLCCACAKLRHLNAESRRETMAERLSFLLYFPSQEHITCTLSYVMAWLSWYVQCVTVMILPQVHLRKPCYDFYFL